MVRPASARRGWPANGSDRDRDDRRPIRPSLAAGKSAEDDCGRRGLHRLVQPHGGTRCLRPPRPRPRLSLNTSPLVMAGRRRPHRSTGSVDGGRTSSQAPCRAPSLGFGRAPSFRWVGWLRHSRGSSPPSWWGSRLAYCYLRARSPSRKRYLQLGKGHRDGRRVDRFISRRCRRSRIAGDQTSRRERGGQRVLGRWERWDLGLRKWQRRFSDPPAHELEPVGRWTIGHCNARGRRLSRVVDRSEYEGRGAPG
jgi:hypothetical protein